MVAVDVVALLLLIGGQSPRTSSPADNGTSIQLLHVPPVSAVPPVSCVPPVSDVPSVSGIPTVPEKYPTLQNCGFDIPDAPPGTQWALTNSRDAAKFEGRAVVGGYEEEDSPLWVIRACTNRSLIPGMFSMKRKEASVLYNGETIRKNEFEVLLSQPGLLSWMRMPDVGEDFPNNVFKGGWIARGMLFDPVYIIRIKKSYHLFDDWFYPTYDVTFSSKAGRMFKYFNKEHEVLVTDVYV